MLYSVKTFDSAKGLDVVAGSYNDETRVYTRWVDARKHLCLKHSGYGIQKDVFGALKELGCLAIRIQFNKDNFLTAPFERWLDGGVWDDLGNGVQIFLADYLMERFGTGDSIKG